jgi:biopolymer transport protein ExbD
MPKVKPKRKNPSIDMTAMVDVAFLLLTFFILTTKFKAQDKVVVDTPTSISEIKIPTTDLFTITVDKDGLVVVGVSQETRQGMLEKIAENYGLSISPAGINFFVNTPSFGVPLAELTLWLNDPDPDKMKDYPYKGIPIDTRRGKTNELKEWINAARRTNQSLRFAIKGDRETIYEKMADVIATLQDVNINRFNLITGLEADPNGPKPEVAEAPEAEGAPKDPATP